MRPSNEGDGRLEQYETIYQAVSCGLSLRLSFYLSSGRRNPWDTFWVKGSETMKYIDALSIWTGKISSMLIFPLIFSLVYEVIARYFFNAPTDWSFELSYMLYGAYFILGVAYTLQAREHIAIDIVYVKFSPKVKAIVELVGYVILFFPAMAVLFYYGIVQAFSSWSTQETSTYSAWMPLLYPLKAMLPLGILLLLLQGVAEFVKLLNSIRGSVASQRQSS